MAHAKAVIADCKAVGFDVKPTYIKDQLVEWEVRIDGEMIGVVGLVGPPDWQKHPPATQFGHYAVDAAVNRLPGAFRRVVDACGALAVAALRRNR